jgi:hypothetical protein
MSVGGRADLGTFLVHGEVHARVWVPGTLARGEITPVGPGSPAAAPLLLTDYPGLGAAPVRERIVKRLHNNCEQTPACGRPAPEDIGLLE